MTNFDIIADRIINAEGVSFAIGVASNISGDKLVERRETLKRAIVEALEDVHMGTIAAVRDHFGPKPDLPSIEILAEIRRAQSKG